MRSIRGLALHFPIFGVWEHQLRLKIGVLVLLSDNVLEAERITIWIVSIFAWESESFL